MIKKKFFKTRDECEVTFECAPAQAESVELVCEANGWQPISMKKKKGGAFRTRLRLPRDSQFEFRYLLDGRTWANDEAADSYAANVYGSDNGVVFTRPSS